MREGIQISPALVDIQPGEVYVLTIKNNQDTAVRVVLSPVLLSVDSAQNKLVLSDQSLSANLAEYIEINNNNLNLEIAPEASVELQVKYLKEFQDSFLGTSVKQSTNGEGAVGVSGQIISAIVPSKIDEAELAKIESGIVVKPNLSIFGVNIGNGFDISSNITNNTNRAIKPAGQVTLFYGDKRVANESFTSKLTSQMLPGSNIQVDSKVSDNRPFWQRIGRHELQQTLVVNGKNIAVSESVLSLPGEFLAIVFLLFAALIASSVITLKKIKGKRFERKPKTAKIQ